MRQYLKRILLGIVATLGAWQVYINAIATRQPDVTPPNPPALTYLSNGLYRVAVEYRTSETISGVVHSVTIPMGFVTDGASIPKALQWPLGLTRTSPSIIRGAVWHDFRYRMGEDKALSDLILYHCCLYDGTETNKAKAIYEAVKTWGWTAFER